MDQQPPKKDLTPFAALGLVWDIGIEIAVPTVMFGLAGRWLDRRYATSPLFLILGLFLSLAIVTILIVRKGRDIAKRF